MKLAGILIVLALAAGCSSPPLGQPTLATVYGRTPELGPWRAVIVDRGHFQADLTDFPCPMSNLIRTVEFLSVLEGKTPKSLGELMGTSMGSAMDAQCVRGPGRVYGGPERLVLALLRFDDDPQSPREALVVDCPRLKSDEKDRLFKAGDFAAAWERPPHTVEASLLRGWVHVYRKNSIPDDPMPTYDFEVFLVLARPDGSGEPLQVIARVESQAR